MTIEFSERMLSPLPARDSMFRSGLRTTQSPTVTGASGRGRGSHACDSKVRPPSFHRATDPSGCRLTRLDVDGTQVGFLGRQGPPYLCGPGLRNDSQEDPGWAEPRSSPLREEGLRDRTRRGLQAHRPGFGERSTGTSSAGSVRPGWTYCRALPYTRFCTYTHAPVAPYHHRAPNPLKDPGLSPAPDRQVGSHRPRPPPRAPHPAKTLGRTLVAHEWKSCGVGQRVHRRVRCPVGVTEVECVCAGLRNLGGPRVEPNQTPLVLPPFPRPPPSPQHRGSAGWGG